MFRRTNDSPGLCRNDRGVALLIVLLVTALLIALIFEFSYATRISLNNAINFRDSQRAYYLALSGLNAFKNPKYGDKLREMIPQGEWGVVPVISEGDTVVRIKWEDESGKIKINDVRKDPVILAIVTNLFETVENIDTSVINKIIDPSSDISNLSLLSGLHQYMSDEDFIKVSDCLTMNSVKDSKGYVSININTAPADVLLSLGISPGAVGMIVEARKKIAYTDSDLQNGRIPGIEGVKINTTDLKNLIATTSKSGIYKLYSYATVGGYTKQIEAIVNGSGITFWRAL
jgi:type II secretory pathway component PulK